LTIGLVGISADAWFNVRATIAHLILKNGGRVSRDPVRYSAERIALSGCSLSRSLKTEARQGHPFRSKNGDVA
jgi:hypothetical protein